MMNEKSVLCNETFTHQIDVGVARHSVVGGTVYGATLRNHVKKTRHRGGSKAMVVMPKHRQEETREKYENIAVTETTAEIVCIVCKDGASTRPNEIVLCDKCGVGYHQKCHNPVIEDKALEPEEPWMCVFCQNGSECPHLLNPFETKLREDINSLSVRKNRDNSKDNHYISNHIAGFTPNNSSKVENLMANYYHDTYQRRNSIDSHVRHVPREAHHVMNRRAMIERPRSKYYRYPNEDDIDSRKKRLGSQEKQKTSRDVWDNGGHTPTSRAVSANDVITDDVSKSKGKDGPREKQRLTQDLEKQRKKLKEDVKRGQELQREHTQLLTRDQMHETRDGPTDVHDRRYHNGTAEYSENIRNSSEKRTHGEYKPADVRVNGAESGDEALKRKLDPCECDDSSQGIGVNKHMQKMSDIQCEHSSARQNYHEVNGHADGANYEHARNTRGGHEHAREVHEHVNTEEQARELYTSEKIEVIGESSDLSGRIEVGGEKSKVKTCQKSGQKQRKSNEGKIVYDEYLSVRKERRAKEGSKERSGSVKIDKESLKDASSGLKRSSCSDDSIDEEEGSKRNKVVDGSKKQQDYESDATQHRLRSVLPRHNWLIERWMNQKNTPVNEKTSRTCDQETRRASTDSLKETLKDSEDCTSINNTLEPNIVMQTPGSPVFEQTYKDEVLDEGYTKRISDDEITQEHVISQHGNGMLKVPSPVKFENNSLVQNNHSPEIKYSPKKQDSPRSLNNCSPEIKHYSPTGSSPNVAQTSPNLVASSSNFEQTSPKRLQISPSRSNTSLSSVPLSPSRLQTTTCGTTSSHQAKTTSPTRGQTSPNRLPSTIPQSPGILACPSSCITSSPNQISPTRILESQRVAASPRRVPAASPNRVPQSPSRIPDRVPQSPNRAPISPNEKNTNRPSSVGSGHSIEGRQISPRFNQDLSGVQGELRTSLDRSGSREDRNGHNKHMHAGTLRRESLSGEEENKIIEVTSDNEDNKRGSTEDHKEVSRIQTGKSVNPVSPIVRSHKHAMEEMHPGIHEPRTQEHKPVRVPAELPSGLPFMGPTYVAGYSPKTFTPHLITHNASMLHPGHPALQGSLPGRPELCQHAKPDMNCPFHGKKIEKMHPHVPGYPVLSTDAHMYPQHALHDKLRDKRSEHLDLHSDPIAMQRRLSAVYDRHLVMPHGIPMHHPRYLAPAGLIDEHGFPMDSERYKQRIEAAHAYAGLHNKPQSHTPGGVPADTSKYTGPSSDEKRYALKYMEDKRHIPKDIGMQSDNYRPHHREQSLMTSRLDRNDVKKFNISPQDTRPSLSEHVPRSRPESPGKYSPSMRHVKEAHPGYIQLVEGKKEKTGPESRPSPSPSTLDRESINRDFNERINMLDKTFKEKLEGTDRNKDEVIAAYSSAQRRHGIEIGAPSRTWSENQARGVDAQKYRNPEKLSPNTKHSPSNFEHEQRKNQDRASPRGLVTSVHTSTHKATVPMPSYFHGNLLPGATHGYGRGIVGVPVMPNHGDYGVWQSMRGPARIPGYPPSSIHTQGVPAEKVERMKPEYATTAKREHDETERSLAIEKHRMNLAQLENERRKAIMAGKIERIDERRAEIGEHERPSPRTREEELRRTWELENRKRKLEQSEVPLSPHRREQLELNKRMSEKSHHIPDEIALRKEQYLAMYARQHEGYGMTGVPYPDRARSAGNSAFYRMGGQAEASVSEALRKQREYNERQEAIRKMMNHERGVVDSGEPAKKRMKSNRCMCGVCGKEASFLCSGCQKAWYCSAKCQHAAWTDHCKVCTETKRR